MVIGDEMEMRGPVGHFEYVRGGNTILNKKSLSAKKFGFMCGGTGISPAYQVIKYALTSEPEVDVQFLLVYGNQTPEDILLKDELDELAEKHPKQLTVRAQPQPHSADSPSANGALVRSDPLYSGQGRRGEARCVGGEVEHRLHHHRDVREGPRQGLRPHRCAQPTYSKPCSAVLSLDAQSGAWILQACAVPRR